MCHLRFENLAGDTEREDEKARPRLVHSASPARPACGHVSPARGPAQCRGGGERAPEAARKVIFSLLPGLTEGFN